MRCKNSQDKLQPKHQPSNEKDGWCSRIGAGHLVLWENMDRKPVPNPFRVSSFHVSVRFGERGLICEAVVTVQMGDKSQKEVAEGIGPVDALDLALRKALRKFYPRYWNLGIEVGVQDFVDSFERSCRRNKKALV